MEIPTISVWAADFGDMILPDDFPKGALTKSGWFDKRYKIYSDARRYIAEQSKKLEAGLEASGFKAPSFNEWRNTTRP